MVIELERVADSVMQSTIVQKMSANQKLVDPMSALRMLLRRDVGIVQRQEWAVDEDGPAKLNFDSFCDGQRVLKLYTEILHSLSILV